MMDDLDALLARLAHAPLPAALDNLEERVLARIAAQPFARSGLGLGAIAIAAAMVLGVAGAGVPAAPAFAVSSLAPLGPSSPLAPSTLLMGTP
jgi:hypothetical protein